MAALANHLERHPELIPDHHKLDILVVGAELLDAQASGAIYQLLPFFLSRDDITVSVTLCGPNIYTQYISDPGWGKKLKPADAIHKMTIGEYLRDHSPIKHNLAVMFHPGFEEHTPEWFEDHEYGLLALLKTGLPVISTSYDEAEYENDRTILSSFGIGITETTSNPYAFDIAPAMGSPVSIM